MKGRQYYDLTERINWAYGRNWSVAYTPWGARIICHLTIEGVTRSGVAEDDRVAFREAAMLFQDLRSYLEDDQSAS
jgi:hypothetical protein